jgi:hypothetical protein
LDSKVDAWHRSERIVQFLRALESSAGADNRLTDELKQWLEKGHRHARNISPIKNRDLEPPA